MSPKGILREGVSRCHANPDTEGPTGECCYIGKAAIGRAENYIDIVFTKDLIDAMLTTSCRYFVIESFVLTLGEEVCIFIALNQLILARMLCFTVSNRPSVRVPEE